MRTGCTFLLLLSVSCTGTAQGPEKRHGDLPANLKTALFERSGCVFPARSGNDKALNVIRGEFGRKRTTDWAMLCRRGRETTLLVVLNVNQSESEAAELLKTVDGDGQYLSGNRRIIPVDKTFIVAHCQSADGKLPPIDHQGILDGFDGSVVHYYYRGKW